MIVADANLLLYALHADMPRHVGARQWLEQSLAGDEPFCLCWVVILALEHGGVVHSCDADFRRFPGLRLINPLG